MDAAPSDDRRPLGVRFPLALQLDEEHRSVHVSMRWIWAEVLRQIDEEGRVRPGGPLLGPLRSFREHLLRHFRFEEDEGLLGDPPEDDADTAALVGRLVLEHRDFEGRLDRLVEELERDDRDGRRVLSLFADELRRLFNDLRRHEALEDELVRRVASVELPEGEAR